MPNTVKDSTVSLQWDVSLDGGLSWYHAGWTDNRIYLTWNDPTITTLYETCLYVGCDAASGLGGVVTATTNQAFVNTAFTNGFGGCSVHRVDGTPLTYWASGAASAVNTAGLLTDANGQCGAWAEFFMDVLAAEGVSGSEKIEVLSKYADDSRIAGAGAGALLVKNWDFAGTGAAPADVSPFDYLMSQVTDQSGVPGQNNCNPPGAFLNHFIVRYNSTVGSTTTFNYYDPSYGHGPYSSTSNDAAHAAWEDDALDGFAVWAVTTDPLTGALVPVHVAKKNAAGVGTGGANLETTFTVVSHT